MNTYIFIASASVYLEHNTVPSIGIFHRTYLTKVEKKDLVTFQTESGETGWMKHSAAMNKCLDLLEGKARFSEEVYEDWVVWQSSFIFREEDGRFYTEGRESLTKQKVKKLKMKCYEAVKAKVQPYVEDLKEQLSRAEEQMKYSEEGLA